MYNLNDKFHDIKILEEHSAKFNKMFNIKDIYEDISFTDKETTCRLIISGLKNNIIPIKYPEFMINSMSFVCLRHVLIQEQGFALLSKEWIEPFAKWIGNKRCLEIMAGCGAMSYALKEYGVNVKATDDFSWNGIGHWNDNDMWIDVENIDCVKAIEKYGKDIDIIIISWPYINKTAYESLLKMREVNPNARMIYIGEGWGGCTANDDFFENIEEIEDELIDYINSKYQTWDGMHDYISLVK